MSARKKLPPLPGVTHNPLEGIVEGVDLSAVPPREQAKAVALALYLMTPGATLRWVWETATIDPKDRDSTPIRDLVSYQALQRVARDGQWPERREEMQARIKSRVLTQIEDATLQRELDQLKQLESMWDELKRQALPGAKKKKLLARNLGELTLSMQRIDEMMSAKRERLGVHLAAAAVGQGDVGADEGPALPGGADDLDEAEVQALARHLAQLRAGGGGDE